MPVEPARDHAEVQRVEGGAEVDVERVVGGAREHPHPLVQIVDPLAHQVRVVRHGARPDVARHREQRPVAQERVALRPRIIVTS